MRSLPAAGLLVLFAVPAVASAAPVETAAALVAAVKDGAEGATIEVAAGTFELAAPLELKARMTLKGAGIDKTTLTHTAGWKPATKTLPDPEMKLEGLDTDAYLVRVKRDTAGVTIADLTLHGPSCTGRSSRGTRPTCTSTTSASRKPSGAASARSG